MRLSDDLRKSVVFIGVGKGDGFVALGTGFFLAYGGLVHLITARHVIAPLGDDPFTIRTNTFDGGVFEVVYDPLQHAQYQPWHVHTDPTVDVAVLLTGGWTDRGADVMTMDERHLLTTPDLAKYDIGPGDFCYVVGLFRLLHGKKRNLPIVHTGHIAMLPGDERIPVKSWDEKETVEFEGYLVEMSSIEGLSGSPVLARSTIGWQGSIAMADGRTTQAVWPENFVRLLGLWRSAWGGEASQVVLAGRTGLKVPLGIGTVEPTDRIIDILTAPEVVLARNRILDALKAAEAASND